MSVVEIFADGKIAGAELPKIIDTPSCSISLRVCSTVFGGLKRIIQTDQIDLTPIDTALFIDHLEISKFRPADGAPGRSWTAIGHRLADLDLGVGDAGGICFWAATGVAMMEAMQRDSKTSAEWLLSFISTSQLAGEILASPTLVEFLKQ